jgi:hypothetical protein
MILISVLYSIFLEISVAYLITFLTYFYVVKYVQK